jgi:hypothetical protein
MAAQTGARERDISEVSYLVDFRPEVGENSEQVLPPAADAVVTVIRGDALQLHRERRDLDIGGREFDKGLEIATVEGIVRSMEQLDVSSSTSPKEYRLTHRNLNAWPERGGRRAL